MFRVLMTADTLGGVWNYALDLAEELGIYGIDVILATMGRPLNRQQRQSTHGISNLEIHESSYRLEWMDDPWRDVREAEQWLLELSEEVQPDLIHLNEYCYARLPWNRPKLIVAHSDVYSWFHWVKKQKPGMEWELYYKNVMLGLKSADLVVAPSQSALNDLLREYGSFSGMKVIPNGRNLESFFSRKKEPFILCVGRLWDEAKNIQILDRVANGLKAPVLAAGSTRSPNGGTIHLNQLQCLGEILSEELADYYSRASIYLLPAKYEPFGLSVLEAAASGCALVLGDTPSLRENWQNAAIFVDSENPDSILEALNRLLENEEYRNFWSGQARERSKFFSLKRMGASYVQEYRALFKPSIPISQEQFISRDLKNREV